ncbi:acetoacetate--CoA ligase [Roseomonas sp. M0104]|uniref:Acetoacetate--CoA ligase n=1 Tax=Teichococcus coralli TaxID=2545983 RepID=A0A845B8P6_9PROT|nr:acetoacetate--CoA ligase [Pseudoroseomonas coralli]MXP63095.1 acetoacetate--CoA ligase [Pseudoroseomonas coralli]
MTVLRAPAAAPSDEAVYRPDSQTVAQSQMTAFRQWCAGRAGQPLSDEAALDRFSVEEFRSFWRLLLEWSALPVEGEREPVCTDGGGEAAQFFPNLRLNYAECLLAGSAKLPALTACHAGGRREQFTYEALRLAVARLAVALRHLGVGRGDHVAAIARNNAEAAIAALAAAAIGATFASCAPDMGAPAMLARFAPLCPAVLFACLRAEPWDTGIPTGEKVAAVVAGLPGLTAVVALDDGPVPAGELPVALHRFAELTEAPADEQPQLEWPRNPFNAALFTLFSSGTTGAPKCIRHGAGGTLLEHMKEHRLHCDLRPGDKLFFQTSCGWMMWNWQLSALASGVEIVLYDGPLEGPETFWRIAADERVTVFGTNPAYLQFCEAAGFSPGRMHDLSGLRGILSTGSILQPRQYDWVRDHVKAEVPLQSISGGTDIIGCFVLGNPNLPVYRGEAQCRSLGLDVRALLPRDEPEARIGELICANPFPSRPLGLHGDADGTRFHAAYFSQHPGVWTHGDLIEETSHGGWKLHGRSDGVLNVRGIRVGTAEIYRILGEFEEIGEAMAVEQQAENEPGGTRMVLLVVLREGALDAALMRRIREELARCGSPAFVPARILQVEALPTTFNGKRSETAARDAVNGRPARNREALQNPECLEAIARHPALGSAVAAKVPDLANLGLGVLPSIERMRHDLQLIAERVLDVSPIGWSDNLLNLGADSLAMVNLLVEVERYAGRALPFQTLLSAPSVEGLSAALSAGPEAEKSPPDERSKLRFRAMVLEDREPVCRFLESTFRGSGIKAPTWQKLFEHRWSEPAHGLVLLDGSEVVGFLGIVAARRQLDGRSVVVHNITSWAVDARYRGWGMALLAAALQDEELTYTALTPGPTSWAALLAQRFVPRDTHRVILPPLWSSRGLFGVSKPVICFDPAAVRAMLTPEQGQIFDDHAPYDCLQLTVRDGSDYAYLVVKRRTHRVAARRLERIVRLRVPYSDILHCSAPDLLSRHLERVKLAILRRQRTAALVADARLFGRQPAGVLIPARSCYRSPARTGSIPDALYSEIVLLPI